MDGIQRRHPSLAHATASTPGENAATSRYTHVLWVLRAGARSIPGIRNRSHHAPLCHASREFSQALLPFDRFDCHGAGGQDSRN